MKILHITEPLAAGVFTGIYHLTTQIEAEHFVLHGIQRVQDLPQDFLQKAQLIPWKYAQATLHPIKDILALFQLLKIIPKIKPDLIHLHSSKAGFLGRIAAFLLGYSPNTLYTPHGIAFLRADLSPTKKAFFTYLEQFAAKYFGGKIIACSLDEQKIIAAAGMDAFCIPNGVLALEEAIKNDFSFDRRIRIGTVGHIRHPQKGVDVFEKIGQLLQKHPIDLIWIGEGQDRNILQSPNIYVTGWLDKIALQNQLQSLDIYLSTAQWEGFPYAVLEAMAMQKPCFLSDCLGHQALIYDAKTTFKTAEKAVENLLILLKDKEKLLQMSLFSANQIQNQFNLKNFLEKYEKIYQQLARH